MHPRLQVHPPHRCLRRQHPARWNRGGQPRRMPHQILDRHRPPRPLEPPFHDHPQFAKHRQMRRHGICQLQPPALNQHQRRDHRRRPRHPPQGKDRVRLHPLRLRRIAKPHRPQPPQLALSREPQRRPIDPPGPHRRLQHLGHLHQPRPRQPDALRHRHRQRPHYRRRNARPGRLRSCHPWGHPRRQSPQPQQIPPPHVPILSTSKAGLCPDSPGAKPLDLITTSKNTDRFVGWNALWHSTSSARNQPQSPGLAPLQPDPSRRQTNVNSCLL